MYVETEIEEEPGLIRWMKDEPKIRCGAVGEPVTEQGIRDAAEALGADTAECLMITARSGEWEISQKIGMAALPYECRKFPGQQFPGAWLVVEGFEEVTGDFLRKVYERHHQLPWTILETPRCSVRELALDDLDDLFELYAKKGMEKYVEPLYPREKEIEYQQAYLKNMYGYYGYGLWLIFRKGSKKLIGRAGLEHREYPEGMELELGYVIAPEEQRKGYAFEVCSAILAYAQKEMDFPRVNCLIRPDNGASIHLAEKLGFYFLEEMEINGKTMKRYIREFGTANGNV